MRLGLASAGACPIILINSEAQQTTALSGRRREKQIITFIAGHLQFQKWTSAASTKSDPILSLLPRAVVSQCNVGLSTLVVFYYRSFFKQQHQLSSRASDGWQTNIFLVPLKSFLCVPMDSAIRGV